MSLYRGKINTKSSQNGTKTVKSPQNRRKNLTGEYCYVPSLVYTNDILLK